MGGYEICTCNVELRNGKLHSALPHEIIAVGPASLHDIYTATHADVTTVQYFHLLMDDAAYS